MVLRPIQNALSADIKELPVMEQFYTLQGEGYHTGKAAYFIRLGGCDVGCHWCDVKESWDASNHPYSSVQSLVNEAKKHQGIIVVVTGGEPLMYNLDYLTKEFDNQNYKMHIETSGAYPLTGIWHWICLSPKKTKPPLKALYQKADELKIIIYNKDDFKWAEKQAVKVGEKCKLYLQPEWSKRDQVMPDIINYISKNPKWMISLQTHKYMNIP